MRNCGSLVVIALLALACSKPVEPGKPPTPPAPTTTPAAATSAGPSFVHDDVDAAFARAKDSGKVVFVDGWAPWCHTCLSMQRDVLQDPALRSYEDRVVFAAVDTDKPAAAPFVARFPLKVWPTFFVIDPANDQVLALHGGSLSLPELRAFLDEALLTRDPARAADPQVKALLAGHQASTKKEHAAAAGFYVDAAGLPGSRSAEATIAAMRSYAAGNDDAGCITFGLRSLNTLQTSSSSSDLVAYLLSCAGHLKDGDPHKAPALTAARARLEQLTTTTPAGASVDDRADTLALLADAAKDQGDLAAHAAAHVKRLALLEADANSHADVDDARVHDYARMNSYLALGRGDDAVNLLRKRTQQLPDSYEAWARLASALHQLKRHDEARPAAQRAIELSYGPRRLRYRTLLADIEQARTDPAGERAAVQALVDDAASLPPGQRDDAAVDAARQRLAGLP